MQIRAVRVSHSWQVLHPRAHSGCTKCKQAPVQPFSCGQGSPVPLWRQHSLSSLSSGSQGLSDSFPWAQCHSERFPHPSSTPWSWLVLVVGVVLHLLWLQEHPRWGSGLSLK